MDAQVNGESKTDVVIVKAKPTRRVYKGAGRTIHKIPKSILEDPELNEAIAALPKNYNFEIHKTIWKVRESKAKRVALQLPEGVFSVILIFDNEIISLIIIIFNYFYRFIDVFIDY